MPHLDLCYSDTRRKLREARSFTAYNEFDSVVWKEIVMSEFDFGHFHVLGELGRGGMALVYKAVDTRNDETVALKIMYPHLLSEDNSIKRFEREAKVASGLKHPNIVPVIDFGSHDNQVYIAMKYMAGNSLSDMFNEPRAIKLIGIVRLLKEVASALDYAHLKGIVHRDLKLQNILLDDKKHAYLSDFGIARLVDGTRLTATGQIAGTPMYMSPEQVRGKAVDHRSDIYSFSVMSYLMLTGFYPFTGEDALSVIHKHVREYPPIPTEVNASLPESVNGVLLRGLMKDPEDRYQTATDMVKALYQAVSEQNMHQTTTRIDIHALNPVDSVEMDRVASDTGNKVASPQAGYMEDSATMRVSTPTTGTAPVVGSGLQAIPSGKNGRIGVYTGIFGVAVVIALLAIFAVMGMQDRDDDDDVASFNLAGTQARERLDLELTITGQANIINATLSATDTLAPTATDDLPPTWTYTPEMIPSATITPTPISDAPVADFPGSNGAIQSTSGAPVLTGPGREGQVIGNLENGTPIKILGRTGLNDYLDVEDASGLRGFVLISQIVTSVDINSLPLTYQPANPPGGTMPPPPRGGR